MCYGSEFFATAAQTWLGQIGLKTLYIAPGLPWENGAFLALILGLVARTTTAARKHFLRVNHKDFEALLGEMCA